MTLRNGLVLFTIITLAILFLVTLHSALASDEDSDAAPNAYRVKIFYVHKVDAASATKDLENEINQWLSENEVEVISVGQGCQGTIFTQNGKPLLVATLVTTIVYRFKQ